MYMASQAQLKQLAEARTHIKRTTITCGHPERKHMAHGLCHSCYMVIWNRQHPEGNSGPGWLRRHPEQARIHKRRASLKRLGVTLEQYEAMWKAQGGRCANLACSFSAPLDVPDFRVGLQVDHDHITGRVRGLLCPRCNTALGHIADDMDRLRGLIDYLS